LVQEEVDEEALAPHWQQNVELQLAPSFEAQVLRAVLDAVAHPKSGAGEE
jgi:hypothetical protein